MLQRVVVLLVGLLLLPVVGSSPANGQDSVGDTVTYVWPAAPFVGWHRAPSDEACTDPGVDIVELAVSTHDDAATIVVTHAAPRRFDCVGPEVLTPTQTEYSERIALWSREPSVTAYRWDWGAGPETCLSFHWDDFDDAYVCSPGVENDLQWIATIPLVGSVVTFSGQTRHFDLRGEGTVFADAWASHDFAFGYIGIGDDIPPIEVTL